MTDDMKAVIKSAVREAMDEHACWMSDEDRVMTKDLIAGGKMVKRSIIAIIAGGVLYVIAKIAGFGMFK